MDLRPLEDDFYDEEDFVEEDSSGGRSRFKGLLAIAAVAMALVAGVTVAANINANNGLKLEFGQIDSD